MFSLDKAEKVQKRQPTNLIWLYQFCHKEWVKIQENVWQWEKKDV